MSKRRRIIRFILILCLVLIITLCGTADTLEGSALQNAPIGEEESQVLPGFSDTVVEAVTILTAEPDRADSRRWPLHTGGSVRLAGTLQKLSVDGSADVSVLADGDEIWSRELASGDSIRHGFDIVAYDLTEASALEIIVTADRESQHVQVKTIFQVVLEPFVSRWRADLPSGYPAFTEQEKEMLRKKGQDILQEIRDASEKGLAGVIIPPGDYLFHANWSRASTLKDIADLEIIANGVTFWFEPELVHGLLFENCRNVTVRGLTQDCENVSLVRNVTPLNPRQSHGTPQVAEPMADLDTPEMTEETPAAGKRVRQVAPEYDGTEVYHSLYLPVDWKPNRKYPVIVEYTGNKFPPGNGSGEVKDANLGYGLSGGRSFIWVVMPYVEKGRRKNAVQWWGDKQATIDYCKVNLPRICKEFGGDLDNVIICGFSRGAIGASYIGLADDEIAAFWKGMFTHDHFDGQREWDYPGSDRPSALKRLARLKGRPVLACGLDASAVRDQFLKDHLDLATFEFLDVPTNTIFNIPEGKVLHPHNDLWMHRESKWRQQARSWLQKVTGQE